MKKIAFISYSLHSSHMNYGAALHGYAFQQFLKRNGIESIAIDYYYQDLEGYNIKYPILNYLYFWHVRSFVAHWINWGGSFFSNLRKYKKFNSFFENNLKKTDYTYKHTDLIKTESIEGICFTHFVCESDVICKLYKRGGFNEDFFLQFPAAKKTKKIAYAPSLGSRPFDDDEVKRFKELTKDFDAISTRERQSAEYVSKILNRKIDWVLDPVFFLNKDEYAKIEKNPKESKYLLVYNCMVNDRKMISQAAELAKKLDLELIEISVFWVNKIKCKHKVLVDVGIEEWLGYFSHADFIVCNAFHGFCFSMIFEKECFLFQRDSSDYRMPNITEALGLSNRMIPWNNKVIPENYEKIDFLKIRKQVEVLKAKSEKFLLDSLD